MEKLKQMQSPLLVAISNQPVELQKFLDYIPLLFPNEALCLYQGTHKAILAPLEEIDLQTEWEYCTSCIICTQVAELRVEKPPFAAQGDCRVLVAGGTLPNDTVFANFSQRLFDTLRVRETHYLLHNPINAPCAVVQYPVQYGKKPMLGYREYFAPDENGWLELKAACFAGLARGGAA